MTALDPTPIPPTVEPAETAVLIPPATLPTAETPTGTQLSVAGEEMALSNPTFGWQMSLPADWIITYDSGFQFEANSPDQAVFVRVQAQRWETAEQRLPNARAYVDHWKNFSYGDVFPLYADGQQLSETESGQDKLGGPYLQYQFLDSVDGVHYMQLYASGGGATSAVITIWTAETSFEQFQVLLQAILTSFQLVESSE
jgi:hypothetical protein